MGAKEAVARGRRPRGEKFRHALPLLRAVLAAARRRITTKGRGACKSLSSRSILRWTSLLASFPPRLCQTRNKRGELIEAVWNTMRTSTRKVCVSVFRVPLLGLFVLRLPAFPVPAFPRSQRSEFQRSSSVPAVFCVPLFCVPVFCVPVFRVPVFGVGPWCSPRVVLRFSTVHDPVIASKAELLRSPSDHGFGPGRPMGLRTVRAVAPSMVCRVDGRGVEKRFVASAWRQSPKRIIGTALADLRRAAAANKCVRLAQRLAALTGPM